MQCAGRVFCQSILLKTSFETGIAIDSKIDENRCKQKNELIQVMGIYTDIYPKLPRAVVIQLRLFTRFNVNKYSPIIMHL